MIQIFHTKIIFFIIIIIIMSIRFPQPNQLNEPKVTSKRSLFKVMQQPQLPEEYRVQRIETSNINHTHQKIVQKPNLQVKRQRQSQKQKPIINDSTKTPFKIQQMPQRQQNHRKQKHRIFDKTSNRANGENIQNTFDPLQKVTMRTHPTHTNQYGLSEHDYKLIIQRPYKAKQQSKKDHDKKNSDGMSAQSKEMEQKYQTIVSTRSANQMIINQRQVRRNRIYNGFTLPTQKCYLEIEVNEKEEIETKIDDLEQVPSLHQQIPTYKYEEYNPNNNNSKFEMKQSKRESKNSNSNNMNMKINYNERKQRLFDDDD